MRVYTKTPLDLSVADEFASMVCNPPEENLISEEVALDQLSSFRSYVSSQSTVPDQQNLTDLVTGLFSGTDSFSPSNPNTDSQKLGAKERDAAAACKSDVLSTLKWQPPLVKKRILTFAIAVAAWPKVKQFLTGILEQLSEAKRESAIVDLLKDKKTQTEMEHAFSVLKTAASANPDGPLTIIVTERKQIALWNAYFNYREACKISSPVNGQSKSQIQSGAGAGCEPQSEGYVEAERNVSRMNANILAYRKLAATNLSDVVSKMESSYRKLEASAVSGAPPDDSVLGELLSGLQFLSDTATNYQSAIGAFHNGSAGG
jgi:hypothetical protein